MAFGRLMVPLGRWVDVPDDLASVTTRALDREVDPASVGMTSAGVEAIWSAVEGLYETRTQPAISVCVRRRGQVVLQRAIGHARGRSPGAEAGGPTRLVTPRTPFCIFSASKAITAMLIHLLDERDVVRLDDPVAEYIPEFGRHRKSWITLRHVLTHRAGIPTMTGPADAPLDLLGDWDAIVAQLCDAKPAFAAGRRLAYHAVTGGFILGEVVRRVTGSPIDALLAQEIAGPLGFEHLTYGVAPERVGELAENAFTGLPVPFPISTLIARSLGLPMEAAVAASNDERFLTRVVPAGNIVATADDLSRFFQLLLSDGELDGHRVMSGRAVRRARVESAYFEFDMTLGFPVRYGQGLMLGARRFSMFGLRTRKAFGHYGFVNIVGWADPARDIAGAILTSGKPIIANHFPKLWGLMNAINTHCEAS